MLCNNRDSPSQDLYIITLDVCVNTDYCGEKKRPTCSKYCGMLLILGLDIYLG